MESFDLKHVALAVITGVALGWIIGVVILILVVELTDGKVWDSTAWCST
jgi:hypothetical protein